MLVNKLGINNMVNFKGFVNHQEIDWNQIDVVISTSSHEGVGRTVYETLVNQKYLIAYHYSGIPSGQELSHIIPFGHTHILAREIRNALKRKMKGYSMNAQRKEIEQKYSAESVCTKFIEYCESSVKATS